MSCIWYAIACCKGKECENCKAYRDISTEQGREMELMHRKETIEAIKPVQDKWMGWLKRIKKEGYRK